MTDAPPRLAPIPLDDIDAETRAAIAGWPLHLHRCLAHSPVTLQRWMTFAVHIARESSLPLRDREIVVLRISWNLQSDYEWKRHGRLAREAGLTEAEIVAVTVGARDPAWAPHEAALLAAVDQLRTTNAIEDDVWAVLAERFSEQQLVDLVMLIGEFVLVGMALGALRIPLDDDVAHIPGLAAYRR